MMAVADKLLNKAKQARDGQGLGQFASFLFMTRDAAHTMHLSTRSFAEHKALDDYYSGIVDLIDGLVESAQGKYGLINISIPICSCGINCLSTMEGFVSTLQSSRSTLPQDTFIQNQIDEIEALMYSTIYKLKFLK